MKTVAIVGGGLAGLTTAYFLQTQGAGNVRYVVLEASERWGGKVQTIARDGFVMEAGPDSFLTQKPAALDLCRALGLEDSLIPANPEGRRLYIVRDGRLAPMPGGMNLMVPTEIGPLLRSPLLSPRGKLRVAAEPLIPRQPHDGDESMAGFVRRRLGAEALDRLASPLLAGVYAGDPERLSIHATFSRFPEMEKVHGSLILGARRQRRAAPSRPQRPAFLSLEDGMQQLTDGLVARLDPNALRLRAAVDAIGWRLAPADGVVLRLHSGEAIEAHAVVLAVPAFSAAAMLSSSAPDLSTLLQRQRYVSSATVSLGYRAQDVPPSLDGVGFVVPAKEGRRITACTSSSLKLARRAAHGCVLLRCFVGRDGAEHVLNTDDEGLVRIARDELRELTGLTAEPLSAQVARWERGMPQYDVGHADWLAQIETEVVRYPGLFLTGHPYRGIGVPDVIRDGELTAARVDARLAD
ncbi:MAG: protoporphyrinogen oxidase [Anaerolineae bacterium]